MAKIKIRPKGKGKPANLTGKIKFSIIIGLINLAVNLGIIINILI